MPQEAGRIEDSGQPGMSVTPICLTAMCPSNISLAACQGKSVKYNPRKSPSGRGLGVLAKIVRGGLGFLQARSRALPPPQAGIAQALWAWAKAIFLFLFQPASAGFAFGFSRKGAGNVTSTTRQPTARYWNGSVGTALSRSGPMICLGYWNTSAIKGKTFERLERTEPEEELPGQGPAPEEAR